MIEQIQEIDINRLTTSTFNSRLDLGDLDGLTESVKSDGILQLPIVRKKGDKWEIIAGGRRYRAAQKAGLRTLRCIVKDCSDIQAIEISLIENLHRKDLTPSEKAAGLKYLLDEYPQQYPNQKSLAEKFGVSESTITIWLSVLDFPEDIQPMIGELDLQATKEIFKRLPEAKAVKFAKRMKGKPRREVLSLLEKFIRINSVSGSKQSDFKTADIECPLCGKHIEILCREGKHRIKLKR